LTSAPKGEEAKPGAEAAWRLSWVENKIRMSPEEAKQRYK